MCHCVMPELYELNWCTIGEITSVSHKKIINDILWLTRLMKLLILYTKWVLPTFTSLVQGLHFEISNFKIQIIFFQKVFASHISTILHSRNSSDPMFLYVPFQSVHSPIMVQKHYSDLYKKIEKDKTRRTYLGQYI